MALVNESMNHYEPSSLISEFNALPAQTPIEVDWGFTYVLSAALELTAATRGAYDVSVSALSDLWGFGPEGPKQFPNAADIEMTRAQVGVAQLDWESTTRTLSKRAPGLKLDYSSLAIGYAVDLGADALEDLKAQNILVLDIREISDFADWFIIATASSSRNAKAISNKLLDAVKPFKHHLMGIEGQEDSEWILLDVGSVVVNIMQQEAREFYDLESLWGEKTLVSA